MITSFDFPTARDGLADAVETAIDMNRLGEIIWAS